MHPSVKLLFIILLSMGLTASHYPVKNTVKLVPYKGKEIPFKIKTQKLEWVNGALNLALLSTDNRLVQVNNISEQYLKDTTFRNKSISLLVVDSQATFTQNNRLLPLIEIACKEAKKDKLISIRVHGRVYANKTWNTATIDFTGALPEKKFMSQYKKTSQ